MSEVGWDIIGSVIGGGLGLVMGGPVGAAMGAAGGFAGAHVLQGSPAAQAPASTSPKPPPYPGSTPDVPPYPTLSPPPGVTAPGSGGAANAADLEAQALAKILEHLQELDQSAASTVEATHAAREATRRALAKIQADIEAKLTELGPRLNTPKGQSDLRDYLIRELSSAKQIIDEQFADAEAKARHTRELTQHYLDAAGGGQGKPGEGGGGSGGGPGGGGGGSGDGAGSSGGGRGEVDPGTAPASATPATPATPTSPFGQGMMPGAGMMPAGMSMPSLPSLGGGGIPGLGGGDPLSGLSGLGGAGAHERNPSSEDASGRADSATPKLHDTAKTGDAAGTGSDKDSDAETKPAGEHAAAGTELADHQGPHPGDGPPGGPDGGTHVALPDGTTVEARTSQGATAVKAALNGATVADAWHQAGVTVPPPGTPVTAPIPPTQLKAGDVGMWKDHLVMALGSGKVLVSGQVQPLTSVGSGPDFLGWMDPGTAGGKGGV